MKELLEKQIRSAYEMQCEAIFPGLAPTEDPLPMLFYVTEQRVNVVIIQGPIDGAIDALRDTLGPAKVVIYMVPAYSVARTLEQFTGLHKAPHPREDPDKREIIFYTAVDTSEEIIGGQAFVQRADGQAPTLSELMIFDQSLGGSTPTALLDAVRL